MKRIFLIGYMGSGKTTVGKILSERLSYTFIDLDRYIENRHNKKVADIFAECSEAGFREIERRLLQEVSEIEHTIISTGGGTPCFFDNMQLMNSAGTSIYLRTSAETLARRLQKAKNNRPLLRDRSFDDLPVFIEEMLEKRESFYNQADIIIDNNNNNPQIVCEEILQQINKNTHNL